MKFQTAFIPGVPCFLIACLLTIAAGPDLAIAQQSKVESDAIAAIESAGGKVMRISAADASREVSFYLAGKKIADKHIKDVASIDNVIWLNLANTKVSNDGLKPIAGMKLKKLHLEKTGIGDAGLAHLKQMDSLEYLNLYSTSVTDTGLKHLEKMKNLKRLYVWQSKVTPDGMKALEKKIPGLKVVGECKLPEIAPKPEEKAKDKKKQDASKKNPDTKEDAAKKEASETPATKEAQSETKSTPAEASKDAGKKETSADNEGKTSDKNGSR